MKKLDTSNIIERFRKIHGDIYDYSEVDYNGKRSKISVICKTHGEFKILPNNHWNGQGCKKCGYVNRDDRRTSHNDYINDVLKIHNNYYDYSKTQYTTARNHIIITCKIHGDFSMKAANHKNGQGCKECGLDANPFRKKDWVRRGTSKNSLGTFYIIECIDGDEIFYKFGITFMKLEYRYAPSRIPYEWKPLKIVESSDLNYIWDLEKRFKRKVRTRRYVPLKSFCGHYTECFI